MSRKNEEDDEYSDAHAIARRALLGRMRGQEALQPTTCEEPVWVPKPCEEEFCENARCGAPDSYVDEFRCERKHCETNEDCGPDEECRWLRYLPPICKWETKEEKTCWCGFQLNVDAQLCLPKQ